MAPISMSSSFTLRDETEWVETVECGWNMLLGTRPYDLATEVAATLQAPRPPHPQPYGDATAARQALGLIMDQGW